MLNINYLSTLSFLSLIYLFFIALFGLVISDLTYLWITVFIGLPLYLIFILSNAIKSEILFFYSLFGLAASLFSSYGLFYDRERFVPSGDQAAIKEFDFQVLSLIELYIPIIYFHLLVVLLFLAGDYFFNKKISQNTNSYEPISFSLINNSRHKSFSSALLIPFCFFMFYINYFMFINSVGIGGIASQRLPFQLTGILFYFSRFVSPIIILFLVLRTKTSLIIFLMLAILAVFSSITSLSKAVLLLYSLPLIFLLIRDRKIFLLIILLFILVIAYELVGIARSVIYMVEDGIIIRNIDFNIFNTIIQAISLFDFKEVDWFSVLFAFGERIGGGQDVVLASQMDIRVVGSNTMSEFFRIYFFNNEFAGPIANEFYDYQPRSYGIATGDGGFFAHVLTISSGNYLIISILSIFIASIYFYIHVGIQSLDVLAMPKEIKLYIALFIILYTFGFAGNFMIPIYITLLIFALTKLTFLKNFAIKFKN